MLFAARLGRRGLEDEVMIVTMDIGNTNVKFGVFDGDVPVVTWRFSTKASRTSDEYGSLLSDLLLRSGIKASDIEAAALSSVAPALNYTLEHMCKDYLGVTPFWVTSATNTGVTVRYDNPRELGADRLVAAVAAYRLYGGPVIVVDFGSATTFNLVTKGGEFIGGAIAPGIKTAAESLINTAAKLPRIELAVPDKIVGSNTTECMQCGIVFGYTGLVKYMLESYRALDEMKGAKVVATGGLCELVADKTLFDVYDRALALKGLKIIYELNKK